jgi:hypothetical protein
MTRRRDRQSSRNLPCVPTEEDWGDYRSDLDWQYAHRQFAGRTNEEMLPRFRENVLMASEDLSAMPAVPFQYYVLGFRDHILNWQFVSDSDAESCEGASAASCFLNLVLWKLEESPDQVLPIIPELLPALRRIAENQAAFNASEEIYGCFAEKLSRIEALYAP